MAKVGDSKLAVAGTPKAKFDKLKYLAVVNHISAADGSGQSTDLVPIHRALDYDRGAQRVFRHLELPTPVFVHLAGERAGSSPRGLPSLSIRQSGKSGDARRAQSANRPDFGYRDKP